MRTNINPALGKMICERKGRCSHQPQFINPANAQVEVGWGSLGFVEQHVGTGAHFSHEFGFVPQDAFVDFELVGLPIGAVFAVDEFQAGHLKIGDGFDRQQVPVGEQELGAGFITRLTSNKACTLLGAAHNESKLITASID